MPTTQSEMLNNLNKDLKDHKYTTYLKEDRFNTSEIFPYKNLVPYIKVRKMIVPVFIYEVSDANLVVTWLTPFIFERNHELFYASVNLRDPDSFQQVTECLKYIKQGTDHFTARFKEIPLQG